MQQKAFTADFMRFFMELAPNNHKEWFDENRSRYEKQVRDPFKKFIEQLIPQLHEIDADLPLLQAKDCIFRINRDIRFSKDKSPYKLHASAAIAPAGKKDFTSPGLYLEFSPEHIRLYSGVYQPDKEVLAKIRKHLALHQAEFEILMRIDAFVQFWGGEIHGDRNKILPKELKTKAESFPLLFNKQFYYFSDMDPEMIESEHLEEEILMRYKAILPLNRFFRKAVH